MLMGTFVEGGGPPTWDPQVQSQIVLTQPGIGTVYLKWPSANNNMFQMLGYQLYVNLMTNTGPSSNAPPVLDSRGFPEVREYMQTGLIPGEDYNFTLVAWNQDPLSLNIFSSSPTTRKVKVDALTSQDPSDLSTEVASISSSNSLVAGVYSRIAFRGIHPDSGLYMIVGSVCERSQDNPTCVEGRNYVVSFRPICVLDSTSTDCISPRENSGAQFLSRRPTLNWLNDYPSVSGYTVPVPVQSGMGLPSRYSAINPDNLGNYTLEFAPPVAGSYSMLIEGIVPGKVTVMYWENEKFYGAPAHIENLPSIDFDWTNNTIVQFTSDSVSVRVTAYLQPTTDQTYELQCFADTFCDVWIDDQPVLETINAATATCSTGCVIPSEFELKRSQLYAVRLEYVTRVGVSFLQLAWRVAGSVSSFEPIPSNVWVSRAFATNTPYVISVKSGRLSGKYSMMMLDNENFLEQGIGSAVANRPRKVWIQVKDESNSPCTYYDQWASIYLRVDPVNVDFLSPRNSLIIPATYSSGCLYTATVTFPVPGDYKVSAFVNDEMVSNSPMSTTVVVDATQIDLKQSVIHGVTPVSPIETETAFSVSFRLVTNEGLDIPSVDPDWGADVTGVLERQSGISACYPRRNWDWLIDCFDDQSFTYLDDSMLLDSSGSNFPYFATLSSWDLSSVDGQSFLTVNATTPVYTGQYILTVRFGGVVVTGDPVELEVVSKSTATVSPAMSLVMPLIPDSGTVEILDDTEVILRVLPRDGRGNPLIDRGSETVQVTLTPSSAGTVPSSFACAYVIDKYYECATKPSFTGVTAITVSVNGQTVSLVSGGPPNGDTCKRDSICGSSECPCRQSRLPFSMSINVLESD